jgi:hypothetical protein
MVRAAAADEVHTMAGRVVLLTCEAEPGRIAIHYLASRFPDLVAIIERTESRAIFLRRRFRRFGPFVLAGQLAFMVFRRAQLRVSRQRIQAICRRFGPEPRIPEGLTVIRVSSVNAPDCVEALQRLAPAVVLVNGTRVIAREVLRSVAVPFINCHTGITPKYRGVYGGYWALAEGDRENCGSTVHLIDEGIDTGGILYQARIEPTPEDNFSTYFYLQMAAGLPLLADAAEDALAGRLSPRGSDLPSRLRSHPTLWTYLVTGLKQGVW